MTGEGASRHPGRRPVTRIAREASAAVLLAALLAASACSNDKRPTTPATRTRTYFMGFQTNAEARGTGGLLGGFGILRFDNGKATVDTLAPNTGLWPSGARPSRFSR